MVEEDEQKLTHLETAIAEKNEAVRKAEEEAKAAAAAAEKAAAERKAAAEATAKAKATTPTTSATATAAGAAGAAGGGAASVSRDPAQAFQDRLAVCWAEGSEVWGMTWAVLTNYRRLTLLATGVLTSSTSAISTTSCWRDCLPSPTHTRSCPRFAWVELNVAN